MTNKKQELKIEIEKLQKQLKQLENKENKEYIEIKCKKLNKTFRIYKWENKKIKDFPMPKGFELAEFNDFNYLYDNNLFEVENYPIEYFVKNWSKKNIKNGWGACGLGRYWDGYWDAGWVGLVSSYAVGRVVISK